MRCANAETTSGLLSRGSHARSPAPGVCIHKMSCLPLLSPGFLSSRQKKTRVHKKAEYSITDLANLLARGVTAGVPVVTASSMSATDFYSLACPASAPFFGYFGAAAAMALSNLGAAYGTAKAGAGIAGMGVSRPDLVMKALIPVVMAGVVGIYGLIIAVIISTKGTPSSPVLMRAALRMPPALARSRPWSRASGHSSFGQHVPCGMVVLPAGEGVVPGTALLASQSAAITAELGPGRGLPQGGKKRCRTAENSMARTALTQNLCSGGGSPVTAVGLK